MTRPTGSPARRFEPYPAYKPSGIEWLSEVPAHWEVKPFKALLSRNDGGVWGEDSADEGTIVLRSTEQTVDGRWQMESPARRLLTAREKAQARLEVGDLVVTKSSGSELHIGKTSIVDESIAALDCGFSNFMQRLRVGGQHHARYFWYLLNCPVAREQLVFLSSTTTGLGNLNGPVLGAIRVAKAPEEEQRAIAAFLDRETEKIDSLFAKKERLIELLGEKRAALITQAVTRGLNPSVPMRESGVEWLERIPEHWKVLRLAMAADTITNGYVGPTRDILVQDGVRYLQSLHIKNGEVHFDKPYYVRENWSHEHQKSVLRRGDLVIVQTGDVGQCCAIPEAFDGSNCHALIIVRLKRGLGSGFFLSAYLRSDPGRNELLRAQTGALHPHLECGKVREIRVALPPVEEQDEIMRFIDGETARIDGLVAKIQEAIEKLLEYRTALISSAVTGKIDVRSASNAGGSALQTSIQD